MVCTLGLGFQHIVDRVVCAAMSPSISILHEEMVYYYYSRRLHAGVPESRTIQDYLVGRLVVNSRKVWGSEPGKYNQPITSSGRTRYLVQM